MTQTLGNLSKGKVQKSVIIGSGLCFRFCLLSCLNPLYSASFTSYLVLSPSLTNYRLLIGYSPENILVFLSILAMLLRCTFRIYTLSSLNPHTISMHTILGQEMSDSCARALKHPSPVCAQGPRPPTVQLWEKGEKANIQCHVVAFINHCDCSS